MSLINFSVISPSIELGVLLSSLSTIIPQNTIEQAIEQSQSQHQRKRSLPTEVVDVVLFPALLLAQEYHWRWEAENTLDEMKTHLNGRKTLIRSKNPREVIQEIYGMLLAHYCLRCLMFRAAEQAEISPLRLGFTGTLRVIRRAVPLFQQAAPEQMNLFMSWLIAEILDNQLPPRQGRINPRVVKKPRSKFKAAKPCHRTQETQLQQLTFRTVKVA